MVDRLERIHNTIFVNENIKENEAENENEKENEKGIYFDRENFISLSENKTLFEQIYTIGKLLVNGKINRNIWGNFRGYT